MATASVPSISVNKLGEFVCVSDAKKKTILKTLKFPSTFINARYTVPKNSVINFLVDENHDIEIFQAKRNQIDSKKADTDWQKNNKLCCLSAIDNLTICANTILTPFLKFTSQRGLPKKDSSRNINGVTIHLNPDIVLLGKDGKTVIGAIRLVFSKGRVIGSSEGGIISGLVKDHLERLYKVKLKASNCIVIDVFRMTCIKASDDFEFLGKQVKQACNEIAKLWPTITK